MEIVAFDPGDGVPIRDFASTGAHSVPLASGGGDAHLYWIHLAPGGEIGPHEATFGQLFAPVRGTGWIAGPDGVRRAIGPGEAGFVERGEVHSKGSDEGMVAVMVQVRDLTRPA
jgi:quercetin dioxygenase-like cupin family protein